MSMIDFIIRSIVTVIEYLTSTPADNYNLLDLNTYHPSNRPAHDLTAPFSLRPLLWIKHDQGAPTSALAAQLDPGRINWKVANQDRVDGWLGPVKF